MKITIFKYICSNDPQAAINCVKRVCSSSPRSGVEAEQIMYKIMKQGTEVQKQMLLTEIIKVHPDIDLFMEVQEYLNSDLNIAPEIEKPINVGKEINEGKEIKMACTGCGGGCGSNMLRATGDSALQEKINQLSVESTTTKTVNEKIFKIVIVAAVVFIAYKLFNQK
jgi:hypothetical protein